MVGASSGSTVSASPLANESSPPSSAAKSAIATPRVLASSSAADAEALRASDPAMEAERSRHGQSVRRWRRCRRRRRALARARGGGRGGGGGGVEPAADRPRRAPRRALRLRRRRLDRRLRLRLRRGGGAARARSAAHRATPPRPRATARPPPRPPLDAEDDRPCAFGPPSARRTSPTEPPSSRSSVAQHLGGAERVVAADQVAVPHLEEQRLPPRLGERAAAVRKRLVPTRSSVCRPPSSCASRRTAAGPAA